MIFKKRIFVYSSNTKKQPPKGLLAILLFSGFKDVDVFCLAGWLFDLLIFYFFHAVRTVATFVPLNLKEEAHPVSIPYTVVRTPFAASLPLSFAFCDFKIAHFPSLLP